MEKANTHESAKRLLAELKDAGLDIAPAADGNLRVTGKNTTFARYKETIAQNKAALLAFFASHQPAEVPAAEEAYIPHHGKQFCHRDCPQLENRGGANWCIFDAPGGWRAYRLTSLQCCPSAPVPDFCLWFYCQWYVPDRHMCCWRSEDGKNWVNANVDSLSRCPDPSLFAQPPPQEAVTQ